MAKIKKSFSCNTCSATFPRWSGRCESCGEWNSIVELLDTSSSHVNGRVLEAVTSGMSSRTKSHGEERISSGDATMDEFLGGGIVAGSVLLLAGQPGIGKSTLLMQLCGSASKANKVLYVSAEESVNQVSARASRINSGTNTIEIASTTRTEDIVTTMAQGDYDLVVVDSIQTISLSEVKSAAGSPSQINSSAQSLINVAKSQNIAMIIVGHVTKQGSIAGPKLLEHIVDVVLSIEGDKYQDLRVLRSTKNRYGSTNESVIYEMSDVGMNVVKNPSSNLLAERTNVDGSVVLASMDGNRPLLIEVQALVNPTNFGYPKRTASGFDLNRLNLLCAVLQRRTKLKLDSHDIYINIVGGFRIDDPGADMAVCMAIASAAKSLALDEDIAVFGEVGLGGELRSVSGLPKRVAEAKKLGFKQVVGPKLSKKAPAGYTLVTDLRSALNTYLK